MESSEVVKIRVENRPRRCDRVGRINEEAWSHAELDGYSGKCIDGRPGRSAGCR